MAGNEGADRIVEGWIRSGIERDERYTAEEVIAGIKSGRFQLFSYPQGIVVTQITGHNRVLVFLLSGVNLDSWKERATQDLRAFAAGRIVEAYCRPGLEKKLIELGWVKEQVVLRLRTIRKGDKWQETSSGAS